METFNRNTLWQAALVSGLLTEEQLAEATSSQPNEDAFTKHNDESLGKLLIDLGWLNTWQVEQLKEGRTKFTLGPYRIIDSIGKGGMGHVFLGEHTMLGRKEAIKVLPSSKTTPESIEAFQREIRAQAQLDHTNLVRVSYADRDGDTYFFVTEFVSGSDLRQLVKKFGRLTTHEAATIISHAAQGLDYAHKKGLVHRDVKPGNLLVTADGLTKVTDLGLAWFLLEADANDPQKNKIAGTSDYLAPEMIRSPNDITPASDIYSLGCTLYYAVTGKVPFPGGKTSDKIRRHLEEVPLNPRHFNPDLSDMFVDVIAAMMEKDPARRISSAAEVIQRLRPWTLEAVAIGVSDRGLRQVPRPVSEDGKSYDGTQDTATELEYEERKAESNEDNSDSHGTLKIASWKEDTEAIDEELSSEMSASQLLIDVKSLPIPLIITVLLAVCAVFGLLTAIILQSK